MNENEKNFLSEIARKAGGEVKERAAACFGINETDPDPDPETERMIAEKEAEGEVTPDELLLDAMENVCVMIEIARAEADRVTASTLEIAELMQHADSLARTAMQMHHRLTFVKTSGGSFAQKLRFMREVEQRNDEKIREWSEKQ